MRIVSIIGHKKSGKTALIEELIPVLSSRGHRFEGIGTSTRPATGSRERRGPS